MDWSLTLTRIFRGPAKEKREKGHKNAKKKRNWALDCLAFPGPDKGLLYSYECKGSKYLLLGQNQEKEGKGEKGNTKAEPASNRLHSEDNERHNDKNKREHLPKVDLDAQCRCETDRG